MGPVLLEKLSDTLVALGSLQSWVATVLGRHSLGSPQSWVTTVLGPQVSKQRRSLRLGIYCIAENFRGRKLLWIGEKDDFCGENFHRLLAFAVPKDATPQNFVEKTFANSHKTTQFTKVCSLESFPLYGNCCIQHQSVVGYNVCLCVYYKTIPSPCTSLNSNCCRRRSGSVSKWRWLVQSVHYYSILNKLEDIHDRIIRY